LVGAELQRRFLELGWVARTGATRAFKVTDAGKVELKETFGVDLDIAGASRDLLSPRQPGESPQRAAS
jgi:hypothetical protein